jgi:hypothetical protein
MTETDASGAPETLVHTTVVLKLYVDGTLGIVCTPENTVIALGIVESASEALKLAVLSK